MCWFGSYIQYTSNNSRVKHALLQMQHISIWVKSHQFNLAGFAGCMERIQSPTAKNTHWTYDVVLQCNWPTCWPTILLFWITRPAKLKQHNVFIFWTSNTGDPSISRNMNIALSINVDLLSARALSLKMLPKLLRSPQTCWRSSASRAL